MSASETDLPFAFIYEKKLTRLPAATDADIAALEARFGALPDDYRHFLSTINGGRPAAKRAPPRDPADAHADDPRRCLIAHPKYPFEVECFNGLGAPTDAYAVESRSKRPSEALGREVVAIAGNGAGDQLILLAPGDPTVYQWVHDEKVAPVPMAASFSELLELIRPAFEA
jgi:hypothetical protein